MACPVCRSVERQGGAGGERRPPARALHGDGWASRGVLSKRLWLGRREQAIADHHRRMANVLTAVIAAGVPILAWGLWVLDPWATVAGTVVVLGAKLWFVDRMVRLYDEAMGAVREAVPTAPRTVR
ncbi:DUF6653 family protein [Acuticoccus sp.]|uniref:DUF6653 family protein n=1 Tax=Acuticoccus sp. TaxID=1904378 RepID=UPI003B527E26